jgi:hypothetical protein
VDRLGRGAAAGAAAAAVWTLCDPVFKRAFGTPYSDAELLSGFVTRGRLQPLVSLAVHSANGAAFGYVFTRAGLRGVGAGVLVAVAENGALWPLIRPLERRHPSVRDGSWPPLFANPRVFAQATTAHAFFGAMLGALAPK